MQCNICGTATESFAEQIVLRRFPVRLFRCPACEFIQTEEPYWLAEAYAEAINETDVGLISRNVALADISRAVINLFFDRNGRFLDWGGGYGVFTRMMRDRGLEFFRYDKYCANLFARGLDLKDAAGGRFELVTAFEVFEHVADPVGEVRSLLQHSDSILFTTQLLPEKQALQPDWWYFGAEHGQHVSFYSLHSLRLIAEQFGLRLFSDGRLVHLLTSKRIVDPAFRFAVKPRIALMLNLLFHRPSLLPRDYQAAIDRIKIPEKHESR